MTKSLLACCVITVLLSMSAHADWISGEGGRTPPKAVVAGNNSTGQPLYVCRAQYEGGLHPGKLAGTSPNCNVSHDGREYSISDYEVLVGDGYNWVTVYSGEIPFDALPGGKDQQGDILYICRGDVNSKWQPGKMSRALDGCSIPHEGKELKAPWYEVLVGN